MEIEEQQTNKEESEMETEGQDSFGRYKMSKSPRGLCFIINNINFQQAEQVRHGAEIDEKKLTELFKNDLSFNVEIKKDLKSYEMGRVAAEVAQRDHKEFDAFVFIIMSHGGHKEVIQGVDGNTLPIENLMNEFSPRKCPALENKPKLFIIQSCRGSRRGNGSTDMSDVDCDPEFLSDSTLPKGVCPLEADFLLAFSTPPDFVAYRNKTSGSCFVQVLVEVIRKHHRNHHLLDILTEVARRVVEEGKGKQVPATTHTLRKQLWL